MMNFLNCHFKSEDVDLFRESSRIIVNGISNSGKSFFIDKLIRFYKDKFNFIYIFGFKDHPLTNEEILKKKIILHEDLSSLFEKNLENSLVYIDDLYLFSLNSFDVVNIFTKGRHVNISFITFRFFGYAGIPLKLELRRF